MAIAKENTIKQIIKDTKILVANSVKDKVDADSLADVAISGDYADLSNTPDISGKEDNANKVSSWSTITSDINYPSEKLVKSELDKKVNLTSSQQIPSGADLNDYTNPGTYTCLSGTIANSLINCPHKNTNFKLIVSKNSGNSSEFWGYQYIVGTKSTADYDAQTYYRGIVTNSSTILFSPWKKVAYEDEVHSLTAPTTEIPANSDLNDYQTVGEYQCPSTTNSATISNNPCTQSGFKLTVFRKYGTTNLYQKAEAYRGSSYERYLIDGTWSVWNSEYSLSIPVRSIQKNENLNNYTKAGQYVSGGADTSASLTNAPIITSGFKLTVEYLVATSTIMQTAKFTATPYIKTRRAIYANGAWSWTSWVDGTTSDFKDELEETKKSVSDGKSLVASAITSMGQTTASDAVFATMATNISNISKDATATASAIQAGKTAYVNGSKITGTYPSNAYNNYTSMRDSDYSPAYGAFENPNGVTNSLFTIQKYKGFKDAILAGCPEYIAIVYKCNSTDGTYYSGMTLCRAGMDTWLCPQIPGSKVVFTNGGTSLKIYTGTNSSNCLKWIQIHLYKCSVTIGW